MSERKNVRFLKKTNLPLVSSTSEWEEKWIGVFVHIGEGYRVKYSEDGKLVVSEEGVSRELAVGEWVLPGLWFGGAQGWELLSDMKGMSEQQVRDIVLELIDDNPHPLVEGEGCITVKYKTNDSDNPTFVVGLEWKESFNQENNGESNDNKQDVGE